MVARRGTQNGVASECRRVGQHPLEDAPQERHDAYGFGKLSLIFVLLVSGMLIAALPALAGQPAIPQGGTLKVATIGEPVGATILSWFWLGERISIRVAAGCAVMLISVMIAILSSRVTEEPEIDM